MRLPHIYETALWNLKKGSLVNPNSATFSHPKDKFIDNKTSPWNFELRLIFTSKKLNCS